ncbi:MAG TPA: putative solute-binding protein [Nevskiaceae bacterium]|nr:putative solute-binding protein [Nevskiaceae bacterium]
MKFSLPVWKLRHGTARGWRVWWLAAVGLSACIGLVAPAAVFAAAPPITRSFCLFDPVGQNGPINQEMETYAIAALQWGVHLTYHTYSNEAVAAADFSSGKCDSVGFTGLRNMHFIKFAGSIDMLGGLQTYKEERTAIEVMLTPKAAPYLTQNGVELAGILPGGKVFLFARNREDLSNLSKAAGKKVAILNADPQALAFSNIAGASAVNATIATFGPMFNNGSVDYAYAPSFAFFALELYKGLGTQGGIADYPLAMMSVQMDIHKDRFPPGFARKSRMWVYQNLLPKAIKLEKGFDARIPKKYWVHISQQRVVKYDALLVKIRQHLWETGHYDHRMQHLLKEIRCKNNPQLAECSENTEGGPA